jgi:hypothetical protein
VRHPYRDREEVGSSSKVYRQCSGGIEKECRMAVLIRCILQSEVDVVFGRILGFGRAIL